MKNRWLLCLLLALPATAGWKPLFDGKDFAGWEQVGKALWTIEVELNGEKVSEIDHDRSRRGAIGLQMRSKNKTVKFKDLEIEEQ